jgi:hypothetical protein
VRVAREAAYRFMSALAGDEAGFEEATRAQFAGDRARYETLAALDTAVQRTRPVLEPVATAAGDEPFARVEP